MKKDSDDDQDCDPRWVLMQLIIYQGVGSFYFRFLNAQYTRNRYDKTMVCTFRGTNIGFDAAKWQVIIMYELNQDEQVLSSNM